MRNHSHFRSFQKPTFKCMTCDRNTRDTGQGVDHLCMECFNIASLDNQVNDSGEPCPPDVRAECDRQLKIIEKRGGNIKKVMESNEYIYGNDDGPKVVTPLAKHLTFKDVKGYATYAAAQKRGEEVAMAHSGTEYRWVVIALPSGRYTPMVIINNNVQGGPGEFLGERNLCMAN